jgi:cystathionine beta-lyase
MSGPDKPSPRPTSVETLLVTSGRDTVMQHGFVNPSIVRGSTVLYQTAEDLHHDNAQFSYGRTGTPTTKALCDALAALEGPNCAGVILVPSGLAAISTALLAVLHAGDHLLVSDSVYYPTRRFCNGMLRHYGIEIEYFDPLIGADIERLFRPNTRAIFVEAPGSQSFEMPDTTAIAEIAHRRGAIVINDNTWATPLYFRCLDKGVDISVQAVTKYIGGHSDVMFGAVAANATHWPVIAKAMLMLGTCAGPDDVFLALRGLRTLAVRLARHQQSALTLAHWLQGRPEVLRVLHPALETDPGHAVWKRDFTGASGLFSIILKPVPQSAVDAFLNALTLFGMGYSWGGFESLVIQFNCQAYRTATHWNPGGPALRLHVGLEDVDDLKADLDQAFAALRAAANP